MVRSDKMMFSNYKGRDRFVRYNTLRCFWFLQVKLLWNNYLSWSVNNDAATATPLITLDQIIHHKTGRE